jgi:hypothetical protein
MGASRHSWIVVAGVALALLVNWIIAISPIVRSRFDLRVVYRALGASRYVCA